MSGSTDTGRVGVHFHGNAGSGKSEHRFRSEQRDEQRRVAFGYPVTRAFATTLEVSEYLNCDRIVCLICGRTFALLTQHLRLTHSMGAIEYKERYRLPRKRGLIGLAVSQKLSTALLKTIASGKLGTHNEIARRARAGKIFAPSISKGSYLSLAVREGNARPGRRVRGAVFPAERRSCQCGETFVVKRWSNKRFCSQKCRTRKKVFYACVLCGQFVSKSEWYRQRHREILHLCTLCRNGT